MNVFISHTDPQALPLLQQQQAQSQRTSPMISAAHVAAPYQQYYPTAFANMPQFINVAAQQMTVGVMGPPIIPSQTLVGAGPNTNNSSNGSSSGMTTPNSSVSGGPTYKVKYNNNNNNSNNSTNEAHSGDNSTSGVNNVVPKKAVVSVQRSEQSNIPQQHISGAPPMMLPASSIRYYSHDYLTQRMHIWSLLFMLIYSLSTIQ